MPPSTKRSAGNRAAMRRTVSGATAFMSAKTGPSAPIRPASSAAKPSAAAGGMIDSTRSDSAATASSEPTSSKPAASASPRVLSLRPERSVTMRSPLHSRRARPTPCPISPGLSMPTVFKVACRIRLFPPAPRSGKFRGKREEGHPHEGRRSDFGNPEARRHRNHHRLPGEPCARICRASRYPPDHRPAGTGRPAHGGCHLAHDLRRHDRRLRHAARSRFGERLWRHRPGLRRVGPAAGDADGLPAPDCAYPSELQLDPGDEAHRQIDGADHLGRRNRQCDAPGLHPPAQRARRPGGGGSARRPHE